MGDIGERSIGVELHSENIESKVTIEDCPYLDPFGVVCSSNVGTVGISGSDNCLLVREDTIVPRVVPANEAVRRTGDPAGDAFAALAHRAEGKRPTAPVDADFEHFGDTDFGVRGDTDRGDAALAFAALAFARLASSKRTEMLKPFIVPDSGSPFLIASRA